MGNENEKHNKFVVLKKIHEYPLTDEKLFM